MTCITMLAKHHLNQQYNKLKTLEMIIVWDMIAYLYYDLFTQETIASNNADYFQDPNNKQWTFEQQTLNIWRIIDI